MIYALLYYTWINLKSHAQVYNDQACPLLTVQAGIR